jgi:ABC-type nickel/cobalt efflux system permease component RcnA
VNTSRRLLLHAGVAVLAALLAVLGIAGPAHAHPLGNASVSHYDGLTLGLHHVDDYAVEDTAEIPTVGRESRIDTNGDGTPSASERSVYAAAQCASLQAGVRLSVNGAARAWTLLASAYDERPGAAGLAIGRLECRLSAAVELTAASTVTVADAWDGAGVGWHEITAVGDGVTLRDSPVPSASVSDALRAYPNDMLSSPLDVRSVTVQTTPGEGTSTYRTSASSGDANRPVRAVSRLTARLDDLVKGRLDMGVGALAVLLALVLGAGHAMLPGHGKTVMAAYLVGKRGRLRDVVTVGATVTVTHTAGVLVLGALITLSATFAPTAVEQWLGVVSGGIVVLVGAGLLVSALRRRAAPRRSAETATVVVPSPARALATVGGPTIEIHSYAAGGHGPAAHVQHHDHDHHRDDHDHGHSHGHGHGWPGSGHRHSASEDKGFSRTGLIGLGAAGGLVPSPSALLVLLASIALGRTAFGVALVLAYGVGMAGALTAAGLVLVKLRDRIAVHGAGRFPRLARVAAIMPVVTAAMVIVVGVALALRSLSGSV